MSGRKICVVTSSRAEYGLLYWLIRELRDDPSVVLQLVVTGSHLSVKFGMTVNQIETDGLPICERVPLPLDDDSSCAVTRALGFTTVGFADVFARLQPDIVVLLGDRYETLGVAQAAMLARIPIAHIHGGESTEGAIDEAVRHAITKMAHLHFVAAEPFQRRVIQLGESPERVWIVGAAGLDNIARLPLLDKASVEAELGISFVSPAFLVTYHPVTLRDPDSGAVMRQLLEVLVQEGGTVILTGVNADAGNSAIRREADRFVATSPGRFRHVESLGTLRYLSVMQHVDVVVGNSSSGLLEAPAMGKPTVDIGERQRGRLRAPSVIHCDAEPEAIRIAVRSALTPEHKEIAERKETPYGKPGASSRIADVIRRYPLNGILLKKFHDLRGIS